MSNINVIVGHYGSGKTELSINMAVKSAKEGCKTILIDLDIVNPFFRSAEVIKELKEYDIEVITPVYANTNMDSPSLPAKIQGVFFKEDTNVIFDVGGDSDGAKALSRYIEYFKSCEYSMYLVINCSRPETQNVSKVLEMAEAIMKTSRLNIDYLINNTNISYENTIEILLKGQEIIERVSRELDRPIKYISGTNEIIKELPQKLVGKGFLIERYMKAIWDKGAI